MDHRAIRRHFRAQAQACDRLGSPFTARLCRTLAAKLDKATETGRRVLAWPGDATADALGLRLCGGLHGLVLTGADDDLTAAYPPNEIDDAGLAQALLGAIAGHDAALLGWFDSPPQTNEIARSGMLLPGFLAVARETGLPLELNEIGASAGLNLLFDRFHYRFAEGAWGDPGSPVDLAPEIRGVPPPLDGTIAIEGRHGADIAPMRIAKAADRLRLRAYLWPDQPLRRERLDAAIRLAAATPFALEAADAAAFLEARLPARRAGTAFVLFHSIMWHYMPASTQARIEAALLRTGERAGPDAPVAWLRLEPVSSGDRFATLSLTLWPGGGMRRLAQCDYHGRWIAWHD